MFWPLALFSLGAIALSRKGAPSWVLANWPETPAGDVPEGSNVALRLVHAAGGEETTVLGLVVGVPSGPVAFYTVLLAAKNPPPNPYGFGVGTFVEVSREQMKGAS